MKKLLFAVLCFMMLCGCTRTFSIENPAKVTIQRGGEVLEITDDATIQRLTDQITSMTFQRGKSSRNYTGWEYWLTWYDESGTMVFSAFILSPHCIDYHDRFWICENGTIDTAYYDELLDG